MSDRPILIIDSLNLFHRAWAAHPGHSAHGHHVGGTVGFLKSLTKILFLVSPSDVFIAWEGGGSSRRRAIYPEYKLGRRPEKLNRFYSQDELPSAHDENRKHQMLVLLQLLKQTPCCQLYADDAEGDDLVAYLCEKYPSRRKVMVSSDRDMFQLLDDLTMQYSPHKKCFITKEDVLAEYRVASHNFAIAKALCGDPGDNVPGIKGMGFKTVSKLFPHLGSEETVLLDSIFSYSHTHLNENNMYRKVLEEKSNIEKWYRIVHLNGNMISASQQQKIDAIIENYKPVSNKIAMMKLLAKDGINDFECNGLYMALNSLHK
jgi:5'-3' exonuclease